MPKLFLVILLVAIATGLILFTLTKREGSVREEKKAEPNLSKVLIDTSEDFRALGFSGQNKLVKDSSGNIFATFRKEVNDYYEIFVAKLSKNNQDKYEVDKSINVSRLEDRVNQRVPSIAIDSKDNIHIVWYGADNPKREGDRQIKYAKSTDSGKNWSKALNISYVEGFNKENLWQEHPDILAGSDDRLFVVWEGKDSTSKNQQIKFSKSKDGTSWAEWKNIKRSSLSQSRPTIIQDKNSKLYVFMYSGQNSKESQIWYSTSSDLGESWSDWINISNSESDSRHVEAVVDGDNNIHAVWRQYNSSKKLTQILYSKFDGETWSPPQVVADSTSFQFFPQIGTNKEAQVFITFLETDKKSDFPQDDPKEGRSFVSFLEKNNTFSKKLIADNSFYPNIILDSKDSNVTYIIYSIDEDNYPIYFGELDL